MPSQFPSNNVEGDLKVTGKVTAGSGSVDIINSTGKIPALSSTYLADLSGANLTGITSAAGLEQSHRGLVVGTSPNNDVAATTVLMTKCAGLVTNNGQYVEPTAGLSAIITGSGAGGLDTGSEAASRYYEIHYICNADASSQNLMLHLGRTAYLDTTQTTSSGNVGSLRYDATSEKIAQSIQVARAGKFTHVDLRLNKSGSPTGTYYMTLEADSSGSPSGTPLATSDKLSAANLTTTTQDIRFNFRTPATVATSTTYWMVLQGDMSVSTSNFVRVYGNSGGGYANGTLSFWGGSSWSNQSSDLYMRPFVTVESAALTMPSGYTEACFLGYVYNDASSNFRPVEQVGKSVRMTGTATSSGTVTATEVPMIFEYYGTLPPADCIAYCGLGTDASDGDVYSSAHVGSAGSTSGMAVYKPIQIAVFGGAASSRIQSLVTCNTNDTWALYYSPGGRNGAMHIYGYELI